MNMHDLWERVGARIYKKEEFLLLRQEVVIYRRRLSLWQAAKHKNKPWKFFTAKMKGTTCLDPVDQVQNTILTPVGPESVIKQASHSVGSSPDAETFEHTYAAAKKLVHEFGDYHLLQGRMVIC
jgi:hypothetical protein